MAAPPIEESLAAAEVALDSGRGLAGTGFWGAVSQVKRQPELADRYADRIAAIDSRSHRDWALLMVPLRLGTVLMSIATGAGIALLWFSSNLGEVAAVLVFYVGTVALLVSTHGLAHLVVGWSLGMRFTGWFIGRIQQPQPGVKIDYSTYLRTKPSRRAWMHASGAIATKLVPFLLIWPALAAGLPAEAVWPLPAIGLAAMLTDVLWSTKASDWKKFRREMRFAHETGS